MKAREEEWNCTGNLKTEHRQTNACVFTWVYVVSRLTTRRKWYFENRKISERRNWNIYLRLVLPFWNSIVTGDRVPQMCACQRYRLWEWDSCCLLIFCFLAPNIWTHVFAYFLFISIFFSLFSRHAKSYESRRLVVRETRIGPIGYVCDTLLWTTCLHI